jgi:hypothetical protein
MEKIKIQKETVFLFNGRKGLQKKLFVQSTVSTIELTTRT